MLRFLSRWEADSPVVGAEEASGQDFETLCRRSVMRPIASAGSIACDECGERRRVNYVDDAAGARRGFIQCPDCGTVEVPLCALRRWKIDTAAFLAVLFSIARVSVQARHDDCLWQVGKATWAGRPRDVWFLRNHRDAHVAAVAAELKRRPRAVVFAPTESTASRWGGATENLFIAIESALTTDGLRLDSDYIESRLVDAGFGAASSRRTRPKKRSCRTASIEALTKAMIEFLRRARDHARETRERGEPKLLPRPTKKQLAEQLTLSQGAVTRCFQDPTARELRLYWDLAVRLDAVLKWTGPVSKGRRT